MYLKKELIQIPFSSKKSFSIIYLDENDLKNGVIKLCNYLKNGTFLIQVFSKSRLNEIFNINKNNCINHKNFNYYNIDNLDFLNDIPFEKLRFLNIYSLNQNCLVDNIWQLKNVFENYTFQLCFDNYLETVKIIIGYSYYDKKMIDNIMVLK